MTTISFINALDQPTGRRRLLGELIEGLRVPTYTELRMIVAYAKVGPLLRLKSDFKTWRKAGNKIYATLGVDQLGTSREALEFALENFDETVIVHAENSGPVSPTFHPKVYLFSGGAQAVCYLGSNNLTVGGTETNFEVAAVLEMRLPADDEVFRSLMKLWGDVVAVSTKLTEQLVKELEERGLVNTEEELRRARKALAEAAAKTLKRRKAFPKLFPKIILKPPSPLPADVVSRVGRSKAPKVQLEGPAVALVIQVIPHDNGEVFLSKTAIEQNPRFFGWPFTGQTTPKKKGNTGYPQRLPDPVVNVQAFDASGKQSVAVSEYRLNTVYYSPKSEIRVTFRPDIVAATPDYSILVLKEPQRGEPHDYDISIYAPGSIEYNNLLPACNQMMPSGGRAKPRRFGWL